MEFDEIYHFLFETYGGIGILVGSGLIISIIVSFLLELRTRKMFKNHELDPVDEWAIIEDGVIEGEEEELADRREGKK